MPQPLATQLTHYSGHIKAFTVKTFTSCGIKAVALGVCRGAGIPAGISLAGLEKSVSSLLPRTFAAGLGVRLSAQRQSVLAAAPAAPSDRRQPTDPARAPSRSWARGSGGKCVQAKTAGGLGRQGLLEPGGQAGSSIPSDGDVTACLGTCSRVLIKMSP